MFIFDLDGVLIDSKEMHYETLNNSLLTIDKKYVIDIDDHLKIFDGLPTTTKLDILHETRGLSKNLFSEIWNIKQKFTEEYLENISIDHDLVEKFKHIKTKDIKICVASNAIRQTVKLSLINLGIMKYVDLYVSNEDVSLKKPFPEMYWKCMIAFNKVPRDTVIFEDSEVGKLAVKNSCANLIEIKNREDLSFEKISNGLKLLGV
jgi:beta-phosphoglucomutase-like phosphatase (HAD superfamily)